MADWKELTVGDLCDTISDTYHRNDDEVVLVNTSFISLFTSIFSSIVPKMSAIFLWVSNEGYIIGTSPINLVLIEGIVAPVAIPLTNCFVVSSVK